MIANHCGFGFLPLYSSPSTSLQSRQFSTPLVHEVLRSPRKFVKVDISSLLERPQAGAIAGAQAVRSQTNDGMRPDQRHTPSQLTTQALPLPPPGPPANYQSSYPSAYAHPSYPSPYGHQHVSPYGASPNMAPLPPMQHHHDPRLQGPVPASNMSYAQSKRLASGAHPAESPAKKKQSKWSAEEDAAIIELRGNGMKWEDISRNLPGRSAISCRLRFQNYLERRSEWDEEKKNKLARLYERFKKDMWEKIAKEMALPWRAAEAMHWQIGEVEMANRANVPVFHLAGYSPSQPTQPYAGPMNTSAPMSTSGRSEDSASPRSATEGYTMVQNNNDMIREGPGARIESQQPRSSDRVGHRRNSDMSSTGEREENGHNRRSPRPPTAHDSVASSLLGDRENPNLPKQYLSPFAKQEENGVMTAGDGRRSPRGC